MTISQIESNLYELIENISNDTFVFDMLSAFGFPNAAIKRLQYGERNCLKELGELALRKHLFFKVAPQMEYVEMLAFDTKIKEMLEISIEGYSEAIRLFPATCGYEKDGIL